MKPGRPSGKAVVKRDHLETVLIEVISILHDVDEVTLRNNQAIRRTPLVADVLEPAIERLGQVRASVQLIQCEIGIAWANGQAENWSTYGKQQD